MRTAALEGTRVGNWTLTEKIGEGGMGLVFLAHHASLDHRAAVKVSSARLADDPGFRQRFLNEARTQARLAHPHIVQVFDHLEQDGCWYLVTEYLENGGLDQLLGERQEPVPVDRALGWALEALDALDFAHSQGVIHRDVKPPNLLLDAGHRIKVTDFGIAVVVGERRMTQTGVTLGTPHYMSPEQIRHPQDVDHRTDVYSFGLVLYELLSGHLPFDAESDYDVQQAQVNEPPLPLRASNTEVSKRLEEVVLTALAKSPGDRHVSCAAFARALRACREEAAESRMPPLPPTGPRPTQPAPELEAALARQKKRASKLNTASWSAAVVAALAVVLALFGFASAEEEKEKARELRSEIASLSTVARDSEQSMSASNQELVSTQTALTTVTERLEHLETLSEARSWPIVLADGFGSHAADWWSEPYDGEPQVEPAVVGGQYRWELKTDASGLQSLFSHLPVAAGTDCYISVTVRTSRCDDCISGVGFRYQSVDSHYYLHVRQTLATLAMRSPGSKAVVLRQSVVTDLQTQGPNRLEVIARGDEFHIFLNGRHWFTHTDSTLSSGHVRLLGGTASASTGFIYFDDFELRQPPT